MKRNKKEFTTTTKNTFAELTNIFKKKKRKKKSQYLRRDTATFEEEFYRQSPPSSRKKVKKKTPKPIIPISRGEALIQSYLKKNGIAFTREKGFVDMISPNSKQGLKMDFYLDELITCIEFDGRQHFFPSKKFDTPTCTLETRQANDRAKDAYCMFKGIDMIRISYNEISRITEILDERIKI